VIVREASQQPQTSECNQRAVEIGLHRLQHGFMLVAKAQHLTDKYIKWKRQKLAYKAVLVSAKGVERLTLENSYANLMLERLEN